uniref:Uncharacterized protein n=1 Tax=Salix viminalis TaxID=40686 RepID=A0A6N2KXU9_SALVM
MKLKAACIPQSQVLLKIEGGDWTVPFLGRGSRLCKAFEDKGKLECLDLKSIHAIQASSKELNFKGSKWLPHGRATSVKLTHNRKSLKPSYREFFQRP